MVTEADHRLIVAVVAGMAVLGFLGWINGLPPVLVRLRMVPLG